MKTLVLVFVRVLSAFLAKHTIRVHFVQLGMHVATEIGW